MSMRNTLLAAAGLIVLMIVALMYFDEDEHGGTLITETNEETVSIDAARKAFWEHDLPKAERLYRMLTTSKVADINAWGELGNIYYMQGRWKDAAVAYAEVALKLIDEQKMQRAAFFHQLVRQMDVEQSARIDQHLRELNNGQEEPS